TRVGGCTRVCEGPASGAGNSGYPHWKRGAWLDNQEPLDPRPQDAADPRDRLLRRHSVASRAPGIAEQRYLRPTEAVRHRSLAEDHSEDASTRLDGGESVNVWRFATQMTTFEQAAEHLS